jgi:hypothetical protein
MGSLPFMTLVANEVTMRAFATNAVKVGYMYMYIYCRTNNPDKGIYTCLKWI